MTKKIRVTAVIKYSTEAEYNENNHEDMSLDEAVALERSEDQKSDWLGQMVMDFVEEECLVLHTVEVIDE